MGSLVLLLVLTLASTSCGLRSISDNDYSSFPPLNYLDHYNSCLMQDGGVFCTSNADLYSDEPHELLTKMHDYSASSIRHFNYTKIFYGYCVTKRCRQFYKGNSTSELRETMEACLSDEMSREYGMKARVNKMNCYFQGEQKPVRDNRDFLMAGVLITLVSLAAMGTLFDICSSEKKTGFLACFSLRANWRSLTAPWPSDPKSKQLIGINALRVVTSIFVVLSHVFIPGFKTVANPEFHEALYESWENQFVLHIHWVMQTFFFLSGMFLVYSLQNSAKKVPLTWKMLPKAIFLRWLRLVPVSLVVLLFTVSWFRYMPKGTHWEEMAGDETRSCETEWIYYVMGLNNYRHRGECLVHLWSNACDFHLHIMGLSLVLLSPTKRIRNMALWAFFLIGCFLPLYETITRDLDGVFIVTPETLRDLNLFINLPTFQYIYSSSHTNIPSFAIGMAFGYKLYGWQEKGITEEDSKKYRKYNLLYWCLFPLMVGAVTLTGIYFIYEGPVPMSIRAAFALLQKPVWSVLLALIIFGVVFRIELIPLYRGILELPFWVPLARLSFSLYNVHVTLIRALGANNTTLSFFSDGQLICLLCGIASLSYAVAMVMWLLVEAPINNLIRLFFPEKAKAVFLNTNSEKSTKPE